MVLLIRKIELHTVPEGWEEDLGTKTVWTLDVGEARNLLGVGAEASESNSVLLGSIGVAAQARIASDYLEARWESYETISVT